MIFVALVTIFCEIGTWYFYQYFYLFFFIYDKRKYVMIAINRRHALG